MLANGDIKSLNEGKQIIKELLINDEELW
jgi:hypothetical protein